MQEGKGFYKLNEESIASVREDLATNYQALADHPSEEVVQLLEDYGTAKLEVTRHLHQYEAKRRATQSDEIEMVERPHSDSNPPSPHRQILASQEEPEMTTPTPTPTT